MNSQTRASWVILLSAFSDASKLRQLRQEAIAAARDGAEIWLNWNGTQHLHAGALQVLLALRADLAASGRTWKMHGIEEATPECKLMVRLLESA